VTNARRSIYSLLNEELKYAVTGLHWNLLCDRPEQNSLKSALELEPNE